MQNQSQETTARIQNAYFSRYFADTADGFRTESFRALQPACELLAAVDAEATVTINGLVHRLGGTAPDAFRLVAAITKPMPGGGERLDVTFAAPATVAPGLNAILRYEVPANLPVLIKSLRIENESDRAVRLDGLELEHLVPATDGPVSLFLEDDFVRDAQTLEGQRARSPWIEEHHRYIQWALGAAGGRRRFAYPCALDHWVLPGGRFTSFRVFEFVLPTEAGARGLAFRQTTRELWPWTRDRFLSCALAPTTTVDDYYEQISQAAEVGYEGVHLHHGWIDRKLTSPLFTNYSDYELRPDLFPNGWADVRRLTDFAHAKGLRISFYTIYVNTWRNDQEKPRVDRENDWRIVWHPDDKSSRWGNTLDPAGDWGPFVNRKMEEAMRLGGFDAWHLDGPYYGDVNIAENRGCASGTNQALAWQRQVAFYQRMLVHGWHGEAAQGFAAFANGMSRITTTGYVEGDFHSRPTWDLLWNTRKAAYFFTRLYRPEQATTFIPVWPWDFGTGAKPRWLPLEEHLEEYNASLGFVFGYGFEGKCYQKLSYDGPHSREIVTRWLTFWKEHAVFFKDGYLHHVREPDGERIDAVMHVVGEGAATRVLVVAFNPLGREQRDPLALPLACLGLGGKNWQITGAAGAMAQVTGDVLDIVLPVYGVVWYEMRQVAVSERNV